MPEVDGAETMTILAGMIDGATSLETTAEIHVSNRGDYYALAHPPVAQFVKSGHDVRLKQEPDV